MHSPGAREMALDSHQDAKFPRDGQEDLPDRGRRARGVRSRHDDGERRDAADQARLGSSSSRTRTSTRPSGTDSPAPYLAKTLRDQGAAAAPILRRRRTSPRQLHRDGQRPGAQPDDPGRLPGLQGRLPGHRRRRRPGDRAGLRVPGRVKTIADQLEAKGLTWKRLHGGHGQRAGQPKTCRHPAPNATDDTQSARAGDQYAARHNPFVYFHSIIDDQARCDAQRRRRSTGCRATCASIATHAQLLASSRPTCATTATTRRASTAGRAASTSIDEFLKPWVPRITGLAGLRGRRHAHRHLRRGRGEDDAERAAATSPPARTRPTPGGPIAGPGGGRIGAVRRSRRASGRARDERHALQPLLAPAQRRGRVRPRAARLLRPGRSAGVRRRRLQRRRAGGHARRRARLPRCRARAAGACREGACSPRCASCADGARRRCSR